MTFASLFSGIGGAELAALGVGWKPVFWCEIDGFCQDVLKYWFKESVGYGDIKRTDFSEWRGKVDVLHGSCPCQAVSVCGKRKGDTDDRWLWREMLRAIREIEPRWVSFENVAGLKSMVSSAPSPDMEDGECNEGEMHEGLLYGIRKDLEGEGYDVEIFLIPACAAGAPHKRDRIWIVAYRTSSGSQNVRGREDGILSGGNASDANSSGRGSSSRNWEEGLICTEYEWDLAENKQERDERERQHRKDGSVEPAADCKGEQGGRYGFIERENSAKKQREHRGVCCKGGLKRFFSGRWEGFPSQSPVCRGNDGISFRLDDLAIPFRKWRNETIKAYGNALVPQVLYQIFKAIDKVDKEMA